MLILINTEWLDYTKGLAAKTTGAHGIMGPMDQILTMQLSLNIIIKSLRWPEIEK